ncbi:MAG TPA: twin-arginine translocation signal domain-containing protein, partial [Segetibacter sp.]|nr:twin-arginine translocation signal domain-containing protein [Segetibacter sp.]
MTAKKVNRRRFIKNTATLTAGVAGTTLFPLTGCTMYEPDENINIIGPKKGFSPHIGTLVY